MPHSEEQVAELVHEMYSTADAFEWDLEPEGIRSMGGRRRGTVPMPDVKVLALAAAVVILIVVGIVVAHGSPAHRSVADSPTTTTSTATAGGTVSVPDGLVGTQVADASAAIAAAGLQVVTSYADDSAPKGTVLHQTPGPGLPVSRGSAVSLVVSAGPLAVHAPNLDGLSQTQAADVLGQAGLNVGNVSTASSSHYGAGLVIAQTPAARVAIIPGGSVDIVVSTGMSGTTKQSVVVPNLVGVSQNQAGSAPVPSVSA